MKKLTILVLTVLVLSGCVKTKTPKSVVTASDAPALQGAPVPHSENSFTDAHPRDAIESANLARVQQCRKELDAMSVYSQASYDKYLAEFQHIGAQTNKYLQVKDALSEDLIEVVTPRYQFQIRELCFRIKYHVSQLIINAARS